MISGRGLGIRVVGGKEIPGTNGEIGAYIAKVSAGGCAEQTGKVVEGKNFYIILSKNISKLNSLTDIQGLMKRKTCNKQISKFYLYKKVYVHASFIHMLKGV